MNRAFLFPVVCLLIVPAFLGCRDEQAILAAKQAQIDTQKQAIKSAELAEKLLDETKKLEHELELAHVKSKELANLVEHQRDDLVTAMNQLEKTNLALTTANAKLTQENIDLQKSLAEMESLKQELAALKGAQEKPAQE